MPKKLKIVFLDAGSVDWGDISFSEFNKLGSFIRFDHTPGDQIFARAKDADIVITNKCKFDESTLNQLPRLKSIHVTATGVNNIDLEAAKRLGIAVTNVAGYSTESVAQWTLTLILSLAGNLLKYDRAVHGGAWGLSKHFVLSKFPILDLKGKMLGIIGMGNIGKEVARLAQAFGMKVIFAKIPGRAYVQKNQGKRQSLDAVLAQSDFVTIHCPLSNLTKGLMDKAKFKQMKKTAFLLNMARGGIVVESDLKWALEGGWIAGAATDVLSVEPPPKKHILLGVKNLIITPHIAWASPVSRRRLMDEVYLNISALIKNKKRNRVV